MAKDVGTSPTISVSVVFFADLRRFLPRGANGPQRYVLTPGATVADLLDTIGIAADTDLTAAVNGELASRETTLTEGAEVMLLSPMEGGASEGGFARARTEPCSTG